MVYYNLVGTVLKSQCYCILDQYLARMASISAPGFGFCVLSYGVEGHELNSQWDRQ